MRKWLESLWYGGSPLKWLLWPLGMTFALTVAARRALYAAHLKHPIEMPVPVIVVGNITVGGTGKTPITAWLARELGERGFAVGVVTRGYRGRAKHWPQRVTAASDPRQVGDESVLLAKLTGCPVVAGPDRVAAAQQLLAESGVGIVLSDDGLQHYRLGRRLEIAVVDGERGIGNGLALPAGPLREPRSRLTEVDAVIVNGRGFGFAGAFQAELVPTRVYRVAGEEERHLGDFANTEVHAVAGIAHPERFFATLEAAGMRVVAHPLADHADIGLGALEFEDGAPVLITEKDAVKCQSFAPENVWAVAVEPRFEDDDGARLMRRIMNELELERAA